MQRYGNLNSEQITKLSYESGVSYGAIHEWLFGETRRPQSLSTRFVLQALGVSIKYERDDGTTIRQHEPELISKAEQARILKAERERREKREREKAKERKNNK